MRDGYVVEVWVGSGEGTEGEKGFFCELERKREVR